MEYRNFGRLNFNVSALGFGAMRLPVRDRAIDETEAIQMIRYAIEHGVNYIDTAYLYHDGAGENIVGKALKDGYRKKVKLSTKLPCWRVQTTADFDLYLNEQLEKLGVEYLDFYLLHSLNKKNWPRIRSLGALEWLEKAVSGGRIRYPAFSFHDDTDTFKKIVDAYDWPMCLIQHNFIDTENQAGTAGLRYAADKGIAVAVMEPLLGGNLAIPPASIQAIWDRAERKRNPVEWALQWLWNQPEVSVVLSGMSTMGQVVENVNYAGRSGIGILSAAELALFDEVRACYADMTTIPCTGCGYCMPCPQNVDIPQNIANYNDGIRHEQYNAAYGKYRWWKHAFEKLGFLPHDIRAANCNACGECEEKCPQAIPISRWIAVIDEVFGQKKPFVRKLEP